MKRTLSFLLVFFVGTVLVFSQENSAQKELLKKANESSKLLNTNPEKVFTEAKAIEKEAQKINANEAELRAIEMQCGYYKTKNDFKNMLTASRLLSQKAKSYKVSVFQIIASRYLFEAYIFSGLPDNAYQELEQGRELVMSLNDNDTLIISSKADLFISYANYYMLKDDYQNQLKYIKLSGKEYEKLPDGKYRQKLLYVYYSNIANVYNNANQTDSAKFYAVLSQSKDNGYNRNDVKMTNLSYIGKASMKEGNYREALSYFKEAEKLGSNEVYISIESLYDNIIESYQKLNKGDSVKIYQAKKDSLKINVTENQNKSLHNLLKEKKESNPVYIYVLIIFFSAMAVFTFFVVRKNNILVRQEKSSREYLEKFPQNKNREDYFRLLKMFEEGNSAFMSCFDEVFPGFQQKLLKINPKIVQSEMEFCALLKLKIPTKDIARYKYIEPKTVRNKKYLIRKKLNIPPYVDIYQWFDSV